MENVLYLRAIKVKDSTDIKENEFVLKDLIPHRMWRHCMTEFMKRNKFGQIGRASKTIKNKPLLVTYKDLENFVGTMEGFMKQSKQYKFISIESIKHESPLIMSYLKVKEILSKYSDIKQPREKVDYKIA